ncbi:MAG: regulatory protein RecX [Haloechinothrix sp.]
MARRTHREQPAEQQQDPARQARDICYRLLAGRPRTRDELRTALAGKGIDPEVAEQVLGKFDQAGLIDDSDFAEMWVRSRHAYQGLGRRALKAELLRKGVGKEIAEDAVGALDSDAEEHRARALVRKRLRGLQQVEETTAVRRLVGMLARKGYPEGLAYRVVREELSESGRETGLLDEIQSSP